MDVVGWEKKVDDTCVRAYTRCQMVLKLVMNAPEEKGKQVSLVSDTR